MVSAGFTITRDLPDGIYTFDIDSGNATHYPFPVRPGAAGSSAAVARRNFPNPKSGCTASLTEQVQPLGHDEHESWQILSNWCDTHDGGAIWPRSGHAAKVGVRAYTSHKQTASCHTDEL